MSTKLTRFVVPTMEICPNCKSEMTVTEVTPILFADGLEDVTYRCKGCRLSASAMLGGLSTLPCYAVNLEMKIENASCDFPRVLVASDPESGRYPPLNSERRLTS